VKSVGETHFIGATESTHGKLKVLVKLISIYIEGFTVADVEGRVWKR
jgi:hypothetical protein